MPRICINRPLDAPLEKLTLGAKFNSCSRCLAWRFLIMELSRTVMLAAVFNNVVSRKSEVTMTSSIEVAVKPIVGKNKMGMTKSFFIKLKLQYREKTTGFFGSNI